MRNGFPQLLVPGCLTLLALTPLTGCQSPPSIASRLFGRQDAKTQLAQSTELPPADQVYNLPAVEPQDDAEGQETFAQVEEASFSFESHVVPAEVEQESPSEEEQFLALLDEDPDDAAAWNDLGVHYSKQQHWEAATDALEKAVALEPERDLYRNNLATALVRAGHVADGLNEFTHSVGASVAHYNVGYLLMQEGRDAESAQQFLLAVMKDPDLEEASYWLNVLNDKGTFSVAAKPQDAKQVGYETPAADRDESPLGDD